MEKECNNEESKYEINFIMTCCCYIIFFIHKKWLIGNIITLENDSPVGDIDFRCEMILG